MCMKRQGGPKKSSKGLSHPSLPVIATFARKIEVIEWGRGEGEGEGKFHVMLLLSPAKGWRDS